MDVRPRFEPRSSATRPRRSGANAGTRRPVPAHSSPPVPARSPRRESLRKSTGLLKEHGRSALSEEMRHAAGRPGYSHRHRCAPSSAPRSAASRPDRERRLRQARQSASAGILTTLIPARLERLPWGRFHLARRRGARGHLDPRRARGHAGGIGRRRPEAHARAALFGHRGRPGRQRLSDRRRCGRALLRLADRQTWAQEAVLHHHRRLSDGDRGDGRRVGRRLLFRIPLPDRRGHRRGICGHQFDDPGAHPGPLPRPAGSDDQRQFLDRSALGALVAVALLNPALFNPEFGWRLGLPHRCACSALVVFAMRMWIPESPRWLVIHGREAEGEAVVAGIERRFLEAGVQLFPVPESAAIRLRSRAHTPLAEVFDTLINRFRLRTFVGFTPDGGAGLLLQRDLFHLRACA